MTDVRCVVCGEPWDYYGVSHGDMEKWEAELFRKGAGCPSCEGERPESGQWEPESVFDVDNGDDDPMLRLNAWEDAHEGKAPKWEEPAPTVLWTCAGCGVQVEKDANGELSYETPPKALCRQWHNSHPFYRGTPEESPAHVFGEGDGAQPVCEFCLTHCDECGAPVSKVDIGDGDPYSPGWSAPSGDCHRAYCVDCIEKEESEYEDVLGQDSEEDEDENE